MQRGCWPISVLKRSVPGSDPAGIRGSRSAREAYTCIARAKARFFSRADRSGTHKREMQIWASAKIRPSGDWYIKAGDFIGPTLMRADRESGYFKTDSSTFFLKNSRIQNLEVLFRGDPVLVNIYHALIAVPGTKSESGCSLAARFASFMTPSQGQEIFRHYGETAYNAPLYKPYCCIKNMTKRLENKNNKCFIGFRAKVSN